jgi:hypothetical protein
MISFKDASIQKNTLSSEEEVEAKLFEEIIDKSIMDSLSEYIQSKEAYKKMPNLKIRTFVFDKYRSNGWDVEVDHGMGRDEGIIILKEAELE